MGYQTGQEYCDDGNTINNDSCNNYCAQPLYNGYYCGDGKIDNGEQCDDGNFVDGDGCNSARYPVSPDGGDAKTSMTQVDGVLQYYYREFAGNDLFASSTINP